MDAKRVLIVEDEVHLARFLQLELEHEGFRTHVCHDGREGLELALTQPFELILLDIMLPSLDGIELCRRVRAKKDVPIIMLTARDSVSDKVLGLDSGADDYVTKPFAIEELLARIRALFRKERRDAGVYEVGGIRVDVKGRRVFVQGREVELTPREFDLLAFLFRNKNHVMSRDVILDRVWGYAYTGDSNVVDVYIRYLRSKLGPIGEKVIQTVRGVGYVARE
ncbi:MAG: response regulator transcription factor [Bacillota bacterium]|jgi:Response regulators consisting of a CheY-like receiver domain and a winged-helix DNA-binding domain|nr:DNA-binding response regulator [Bacillota bacterium]